MKRRVVGCFLLLFCLLRSTDGSECYKTDQSGTLNYNGQQNMTSSGRPCLRWNNLNNVNVNADNSDANYCRPQTAYSGIGCFTMNPDQVWETCDITECDVECFIRHINGMPIYYGTKNVTMSGLQCQRWDNDVNGPKTIAENYCRGFEYSPSTEIVCNTAVAGLDYKACDIPECGVNSSTIITETTPTSSITLSTVGEYTEQTSPKSLDKTTAQPVECATPVQTTLTNESVCLLSTSDLQDRQLYWYNYFHSNLSKAERERVYLRRKKRPFGKNSYSIQRL